MVKCLDEIGKNSIIQSLNRKLIKWIVKTLKFRKLDMGTTEIKNVFIKTVRYANPKNNQVIFSKWLAKYWRKLEAQNIGVNFTDVQRSNSKILTIFLSTVNTKSDEQYTIYNTTNKPFRQHVNIIIIMIILQWV